LVREAEIKLQQQQQQQQHQTLTKTDHRTENSEMIENVDFIKI
jgi:hypothetical protein